MLDGYLVDPLVIDIMERIEVKVVLDELMEVRTTDLAGDGLLGRFEDDPLGSFVLE